MESADSSVASAEAGDHSAATEWRGRIAEAALSALIGRKVDLRTPNDLSRYFRDGVIDRAEVDPIEIAMPGRLTGTTARLAR